MKKVVFLGLGYIGLPTAAVAAGHGYEVVGVDVNPSVVETINQGKIHIVEPELDQIVKEVVRKSNSFVFCKCFPSLNTSKNPYNWGLTFLESKSFSSISRTSLIS